MYKIIYGFIFFIIIIGTVSGIVYGNQVEENSVYNNELIVSDNNSYKNISSESKSLSLNNTTSDNKIQKIFVSKPVFKSGTYVKLKIYTDNSIKTVSGKISGKKSYTFNKNKLGYWYYKLNTKNFITGSYTLSIIATDKNKNVYKSSTFLKADNIPPKIFSVTTNVSSIKAGNSFTVFVSADNSTKNITALIRGKIFCLSNENDTLWSSEIKLSYKEINTIIIVVKASDSVGNIAKKDTYISSKPKFIHWNGTVLSNKKVKIYYPNPKNAYEKSIKLLNKYAKVYEGYAGNYATLGITYKIKDGKKVKFTVTIAYKDPFVVYHELAHVLHWSWSEYDCDWYAYNKTGYWIK